MLSKCIGIISWFPDNITRSARKASFQKLIKTLDTYFKLPIVIVAQNGREEDFNIKYSAPIKIYNGPHALGITRARVELRNRLLQEDYDYFIFFDDDSDIVCDQGAINTYLKMIDSHPDMFGIFKNRSWPRLLAISKSMLKIMNYDYIDGLEAYRGEVGEDVAYIHTYKKLFPKKGYNISIPGLDEVSLVSRKDPNSTWYDSKFGNETTIHRKTFQIVDEWVKYYRNNK